MNKVKRMIVSIIFSLALVLSLPITAFAYDTGSPDDEDRGHWDSFWTVMEFTNAPEGTAYIDVLIKMDESDENYARFTLPPRKLVGRYVIDNVRHDEYEDLPIDEDSEIAKLNDDGYISLSLHYKYVESLDIRHSEDEYDLLTVKRYDFLYINKNYGDFKVAYIDENGKVLGITGLSETTYEKGESYAFLADGDSLVFRKDGLPTRGLGLDMLDMLKILGIMLLLIVGSAILFGLPLISLGRAFVSKQ